MYMLELSTERGSSKLKRRVASHNVGQQQLNKFLNAKRKQLSRSRSRLDQRGEEEKEGIMHR